MRQCKTTSGVRVTVSQAARITGRSELTWRKWLSEKPCPLNVVYGRQHGGGQHGRPGRIRYLALDEVRAVHERRGGTIWHMSFVPVQNVEPIQVELVHLRATLDGLVSRVAALEAELLAVSALYVNDGHPIEAESMTPRGVYHSGRQQEFLEITERIM